LPDESKLLRPDEVAGRLGCSRSSVYRLIQIGHLEAYKFGDASNSSLRVAESELDRYIDERFLGREEAQLAARVLQENGEDVTYEAYVEALARVEDAKAIIAAYRIRARMADVDVEDVVSVVRDVLPLNDRRQRRRTR
jgi:excisionase family DNA binding protein